MSYRARSKGTKKLTFNRRLIRDVVVMRLSNELRYDLYRDYLNFSGLTITIEGFFVFGKGKI